MNRIPTNNIAITDKNALDFYYNIQEEVAVRVGRNPSKRPEVNKAVLAHIVQEYKRVLAQPKDYIYKYKTAKISSLLCKEFKNFGVI